VLFLDFKNPFDSIEWLFLFKALEAFGFGDMLVKWIKIALLTMVLPLLISL